MRARGIQLYRACDGLTEVLIYLLVVFTPWAFGTTQSWSIWTTNITAYFLGLLLALKFCIRRFQQYQPPRWDDSGGRTASLPGLLAGPRLTSALVALTASILVYCVISAVNARATFQDSSLTFEYRDCIRWLPHSLDAEGTWFAFWGYLGLGCWFWALRDWLLGMSDDEQRAYWYWRRGGSAESSPSPSTSPGAGASADGHRKSRAGGARFGAPVPARLIRLLWLLALNGALLGLEGCVQRALGSSKLLFLVTPRIHQTAESQFGSYAYRSNAAQYFNLLWPMCLGFWWTLNRASVPARRGHHALLVCAAVMAACPLISTSRGGAVVMMGMAVATAVVLSGSRLGWPASRREGRAKRQVTLAGLSLFFMGALGLGLSLGYPALKLRLASFNEGMEGRERLYAAARPMAADYPWFGTGPGTFETVSQLYLPPDAYRRPQLHNDWLETRITFGWSGSALLGLAAAVVLLRWFAPGGIHGGRRLVMFTWLALAGCLAHARFDFPFQVQSIVVLVVVMGAMLFCVSRRG